jgi:hypothetical protein
MRKNDPSNHPEKQPPPAEAYPVRQLPDGSQLCGKGSYLLFWPNKKQVAVLLGASHLAEQIRKVRSRYKIAPILVQLLDLLDAPLDDTGSRLLLELIHIKDSARFELSLAVLASCIRAVRASTLSPKGSAQSTQFIQAVLRLSRKHGRPPFKRELADELCAERSEIARLCREHGFAWLPSAPGGRPSGKPL